MRGLSLLLLLLAAAVPARAEDEVNSGGVALRDVYKGTLVVSERKYAFAGQIALGKMPGTASSQVRLRSHLGAQPVRLDAAEFDLTLSSSHF